jgi:hypothetical protein
MKQKTTEAVQVPQGAGAEDTKSGQLVSFVYSIDHEVSDLLAIAETLRAGGIVMLPSVGTSYMHADANAWESPNEKVAIRGVGKGDTEYRTIMLPGEYTSLGEYINALARAILGEPEQCWAEGCMKSEDGSGSGYCSYECYVLYNEETEDEGSESDIEAAFLENVRTTWTVRLTNGLLTGYPSPPRAAHVARQFPRHMVVRISGPAGTVPLVGAALDEVLEGGAL